MHKDSILFLTKDALCKDYLPIYGNHYWQGKTPNLDELAAKGTVYTNFFTAAPSSAMSYLSMFTRMNPYQQEIKSYTPLTKPFTGKTLFDEAHDMGFQCHVMWDATWKRMIYDFTKCYGKETNIHYIPNTKQPVGAHFVHEGKLHRSQEKEELGFDMVKKEMEEIAKTEEKIFIWCHLPHVLNGRISYCDDIDIYDRYIGMFREFFADENIFISADHGNMNGLKGKIGYGFDVYDKSICIPLVSPRIDGMAICNQQLSNVNVFELIFERRLVDSPIIYSDSAYYAQPNRKFAVIYGKYRYIYNKINKTEELYDVEWDPNQNFNLIDDDIYDVDRHLRTPACEYFFYPNWDELPAIREKLRAERLKVWREESRKEKFIVKMRSLVSKNEVIKKTIKALLRFDNHK